MGTETSDDAGVFRIRADLALVHTVDFFAPIIDDPFRFGQIAAANALSDVYAMGGVPLSVLNIAAFPASKVPRAMLSEILRGGAERVQKAGAAVVGGHTVIDEELKYGLAVTGRVHPDRLVRNGGARKGDVLVLTKPLGTGIVATALKRGAAEPAEEEHAIRSMVALNDVAGAALAPSGARACTDVTGYGLAGHGFEMAEASTNVRLEIDADALPLLPGTAHLAEAGYVTGGASRNAEYLGRRISLARDLPPGIVQAVLDPQTSGGLLVSLPKSRVAAYVERLGRGGVRAAVIGRVAQRAPRAPARVVVE